MIRVWKWTSVDDNRFIAEAKSFDELQDDLRAPVALIDATDGYILPGVGFRAGIGDVDYYLDGR